MLKVFPKILISFFLTAFVLQMACLLFLTFAPNIGQAGGITFTPQVEIPGYKFDSSIETTGNIANLIRAIYKYAIGVVGILAAVVLMFGGVLWITAGGNTTRIGEAKAWIGASLTGLILALSSYLILATVNPALVNFETTAIQTVEKIPTGSCEHACLLANTNETTCEENVTENFCLGTWKKNNKCSPTTNECPDIGCCTHITGIFSLALTCEDRKNSSSCKGVYHYYKQMTCSDIPGCNQYCVEKTNGSDCSFYKQDGDIVKAVCNNGLCKNCNNDEGGECSSKPCCSEFFCNPTLPAGFFHLLPELRCKRR